MLKSCDVLIIGAGPAGSSAAALLHKAGVSAMVVEKQRFPRFVIGESLLALVVPAGDPPDAAGLQAWCRDHLAPYKVPRAYEFRTELIYNAMGKPDKKAMRAPYWSSERTIAG